MQEVDYLGHKISGMGRSLVPDYTLKLEAFPHQGTITELQRFLGTVSLYLCYIKHLAKIAEPLSVVLQKWDERCHQAFERFCTQLARESISLSHPDWQAEFYEEADANNARCVTTGQGDR